MAMQKPLNGVKGAELLRPEGMAKAVTGAYQHSQVERLQLVIQNALMLPELVK